MILLGGFSYIVLYIIQADILKFSCPIIDSISESISHLISRSQPLCDRCVMCDDR